MNSIQHQPSVVYFDYVMGPYNKMMDADVMYSSPYEDDLLPKVNFRS